MQGFLHKLFRTGLPEKLPDDPGPILRKGFALLLLFVGGGLGWMALAPIDGAVVSEGMFKVRSERTPVQHGRGGVVAAVHVRDGVAVKAGDPLIEIGDPLRMSSYESLRYQTDAELARNARLRSEQLGDSEIRLPKEFEGRRKEPDVRRVIDQERRVFENRRESQREAIEALRKEITLIERERRQLQDRVHKRKQSGDILDKQIDANSKLAEQGFVSKVQMLELQRLQAAERSAVGELEADDSRAGQRRAEIESRIADIGNRFQENVAQELKSSDERLFQLRQQLAAQQTEVQRDTLRAGLDATVLNLRPLSKGSVITPGQVLMELVPTRDELLIEAAVQPKDIRHIHPGGKVEVLVTGWNRRKSSPIDGVVEYVSADVVALKPDQAAYIARIRIDRSKLPNDPEFLLKPGMPAMVYFRTGARTMLEYLIEPMLDSMHGAFRENY